MNYRENLLNAWFNSIVTAGYLSFILYDHSVSFKRWFDRLIESLKKNVASTPRVMLNARLRKEVTEALNNGFSH